MKKFDDYTFVKRIQNKMYIGYNGDVTAGYRLYLPEIYVNTEKESLEVLNIFRELLTSLRPGTDIHFQFFNYTTKYKSNIDGTETKTILKDKEYNQGTINLKGYCNLYITKKANNEIFKHKQDLKTGLNLLFKIFPQLEKEIDLIDRDFKLYESILNAISENVRSLSVERMNDKELGRELYKFFNLSYNYDPQGDYSNQVINPFHFDKRNQSFKVGDKFVSIFKLQSDPKKVYEYENMQPVSITDEKLKHLSSVKGRDLEKSMLYPLNTGLFIPHILNIHIEKPTLKQIQSDLGSQKSKIKSLFVFSPLKIPERIELINAYLENINESDNQPIKIGVSLILHSDSIDELSNYKQLTEQAIMKLGNAKYTVSNATLLRDFMSMSPGANTWVDKNMFSTIKIASCYIPRETHYYSDKRGYLFNDLYNNIFTLDLHPKWLNSTNAFCFADTGSGKTFLFQKFMDYELMRKEHVAIINTKDDYFKFVKTKKGRYISADKDNALNPFLTPIVDGIYSLPEEFLYLQINILEKLKVGLKENISTTERSVFSKLLVDYYHHINVSTEGEKPSLTSLNNFIPAYSEKYKNSKENINTKGELFFDFNQLRINLEDYVGDGRYAVYFNSDNQIDIMNDEIVCFDLMNIKSNPLLFDIYLSTAFTIIQDKILKNHTKGKRTNCYIDECIDSMQGESGDVIGEWYRKNRSLNARVLVSTQKIRFLDSISPLLRESILGNSKIKIFMGRLGNDEYTYFRNKLSFTKQDIKLLENLKDYETFIKIGDYPRLLKNIVSPYTKTVYTTDSKETKRIQELYKQTGSITSAIEILTQENQI